MKKILYSKWPYLSITFIVSLLCSPISGRSMWCDEMLRYKAQEAYTLVNIWSGNALEAFDSQTPLAYTIYKPIQLIFGFDFGACFVSAISASLMLLIGIKTYEDMSGKKASGLAMLVSALCPSLIYFGSELWFYMPFGTAVAWFAYESYRICKNWNTDWYTIFRLALSAILSVGLHFSGAFCVMVIALSTALILFDFKKLHKVAVYLATLLPCLLLIPMYLIANHACKHMDAVGTIRVDGFGNLLWWLWTYATTNTPFYFYGIIGSVIVVYGIYKMVSTYHSECFIPIVSFFSVVPYIVYSHLRGYDMNAPRFWSFAIYLAIIGVVFAVESSKFRKTVASFLLIVGILTSYGMVVVDGRSVPYEKLSNELDSKQPGTMVVFVNHYECRWFTWKYEFKTKRQLICPGYWEQGVDFRREQLKRIASTHIPFVMYISSKDDENLARSAGMNVEPLVSSGEFISDRMFSLVGMTRFSKPFKPYFSKVNN